jgi:hypothetical protein
LKYSRSAPERQVMGKRARETILATMDVPVTSQGVRKAYDIASANFDARKTSNRNAQPTGQRPVSLSSALLDRIAILEQLVWAEALMLQAQRPLALRMMVETWIKYPLSTLPLRFLLRNILPQRLVRALVRAKVRVVGST